MIGDDPIRILSTPPKCVEKNREREKKERKRRRERGEEIENEFGQWL